MLRGEEWYLQKAIVDYFRLKFPNGLIFSVPNEATYRNKQYFQQTGAMAGVSDLVVVLPSKIYFVELKSAKGKQSPEQKDFEDKIKELEFQYFIVRSLDEFKQILEK